MVETIKKKRETHIFFDDAASIHHQRHKKTVYDVPLIDPSQHTFYALSTCSQHLYNAQMLKT